MPAPQIIRDLVEQFERNIETYKRAQNETQVRRELIDPFLKKELPQAKTQHSRTQLERQIAHADREIDRLVYELYGLSEEEIKVVEGEDDQS